MTSLSRRFLVGVGVTSVTITLLGSLAAFFVFRSDLETRQVKHLGEYVDQRQVNVARRFDVMGRIQRASVDDLRAEMDRLSPSEIDRLFDRHYPLHADGTRRSRPEDFEGHREPSGEWVKGVGAFLANGADVSPDAKRAMVAAYNVVRQTGAGVRATYDSFYFATPEDRVVIYAPGRLDHLRFYRETAPASLTFHGEQSMQLVLPAADPKGETRCTSLQHYLQDDRGPRQAAACLTPATWRGRYIGAVGSSMHMRDYLATAVQTQMQGVTGLLIDGQGAALAFPGANAAAPDAAEAAAAAKVERAFDTRALLARVRAQHQEHGVIASPDGRQIVAYARIDGPDWWLLLSYPRAQLHASAFRSAVWVLAIGLIASLLQTLAIVHLARVAIARPLRRLADSGTDPALLTELTGRRDEIGVLGRALRHERDKTHALLVSLEERVAERTAELERASTEKDRFLANMSHELRTPLNGVIAVSETLAGLQRSKRAKEMAHLIVSSSRLLEHVLSDVLDFSRLESGEVSLTHEAFDLGRVLAHTAELHRAVAEGKGLALSLDVAPAAAGGYLGDPVRLTQVVSNLLSNAVKFTERGSIELTAAAMPKGVRLTVTDTGIGFDAAAGGRLFQRFEQADPSISRRFGGTGLGLAICRSLVEAMGGAIRARSAPGAGASFTVELPLPRAADAPAESEDEAETEEATLAGVRVLLAEDHPTNQKVVELILESAGVELMIVDDGRAALEALGGGGFDVVLMDMQMPGMDGLSATRLWREREAMLHLPRTPVVMLTANALPEHVEASLKAGADRHLAKPIRAAELLQVVESFAAASPAPKIRAA